jgi:hypothetical protein
MNKPMKTLQAALAVLLAAWLSLGMGAMPTSASMATHGGEQAMSNPPTDGAGCAEHGHAKKADSCCVQCPCCLALPLDPPAVATLRMAPPIAMSLVLRTGLRMAPEPAPPRQQA